MKIAQVLGEEIPTTTLDLSSDSDRFTLAQTNADGSPASGNPIAAYIQDFGEGFVIVLPPTDAPGFKRDSNNRVVVHYP